MPSFLLRSLIGAYTLIVGLAQGPNNSADIWVDTNVPGLHLFQGDDYRCTSWAVTEHLAFTAAHCIPAHTKVGAYVGTVLTDEGWIPATLQDVGLSDFVHDYALIRVEVKFEKTIKLRHSLPGPEEKLYPTGYAGDFQLMQTEARVIGPQYIFGSYLSFFDYTARSGDSGGPVLDAKGRAVALVFASNDISSVTLAVPAFELEKVLARNQ